MLRCILILAVSSAHFCVHASHLEVENSTRLVPFEYYEEVFFNLHQFSIKVLIYLFLFVEYTLLSKL